MDLVKLGQMLSIAQPANEVVNGFLQGNRNDRHTKPLEANDGTTSE